MKDFHGQELAVGDEVTTTPKNYRGLVRGKIVAFTPQQVRVEYLNTWNYGEAGRAEKFLTYPSTVVKILPPQPTTTELWDKFIEHLNKVQPLGKKGEIPHQSFIGSIAAYRKIFLAANK